MDKFYVIEKHISLQILNDFFNCGLHIGKVIKSPR